MAVKTILLLYAARIASGMVNGYLSMNVIAVSDSRAYHRLGLEDYEILKQHPKAFFSDIFIAAPGRAGKNIFDTTQNHWNNLKNTLMSKLMAIFDIFSFGNFYTNIIFYNFLVFIGSMLLYKLFIRLFPSQKKLLIFCFFLFPSCLFFTSAIHRDGLIFFLLSMILFHFYHLINDHTHIAKRIVIILISLVFIFLLRNFIVIALVPALIAYTIANRFPQKTFAIFIGCYLLFGFMFFGGRYIHPALDFPKYVAQRQNAFEKISGDAATTVPINTLELTLRSFAANAPQAFGNSLLRPYPWQLTEKYYYIPFVLEIFSLAILFFLMLFYKSKICVEKKPFLLMLLFFTLSILMIIGYTIPVLAAIIRYRSVYLPFLFLLFGLSINWNRLRRTHIL
ncbi:hypothetical protein BH09BAC2_BH09BAC2_12410 [soil metagenome]